VVLAMGLASLALVLRGSLRAPARKEVEHAHR
jgi:hypothetical protein